MATVEERLTGIRTQQQEAGRRRATAEAKLDEVRARRENLMAALKEHGCADVGSAQQRLAELSEESEKALALIEEKVRGL